MPDVEPPGRPAEIPEEFQDHPSLFGSIYEANFLGATKTEDIALRRSMYTGFVDPSVDSRTRMRARDDAIKGLGWFGVQFDWAEWRREMGYAP